MTSLIATADPTTGTIRVDVEQTIGRDLYTRVVANGWGNMTTGQAWTFGGGVAGDYSVNGTQGLMSISTVNAVRRQTFNTGFSDHDITAQVTVSALALTSPIEPSVLFRLTDANNYYYAALSIAPGGVVTLQIKKRVLAANGTVNGTFVLPVTHVAGTTYLIRAAACGSTLMAKAWVSTTTEPDWMIVTSDFDLPTGTLAGVRGFLEAGNTNVLPFVLPWDNMVTITGQPVRLFRVTPDGVRTEVRGSPGFTEPGTAAAATATATYWDNEAPFGVVLTYELTSNCTPATAVTTVNVVLDDEDNGWLRDPIDPTRNIRITMDALFDECVDTDVVVYSGMDTKTFANASGIFDIIDDRRPVTISQTRKNYASVLRLTSFSLDDIDVLEDIFDPGRILLLSLPTVYGWAHRNYGTDYITCFTVEQDFLGVDQQVSVRAWTVPFKLSYAPTDITDDGAGGNGIGGGGATYDDLAASVIGATYNSLTASGFTYAQIRQGTGY